LIEIKRQKKFEELSGRFLSGGNTDSFPVPAALFSRGRSSPSVSIASLAAGRSDLQFLRVTP